MDIIRENVLKTTQNSYTFPALNNMVRKGKNVLVLLYNCTVHM